ncbi:hypothetical protein BDF14DRAFT_1884378 [Spinellus fusiger]|nr:hypothetical protein BDF14DRAFT_1884378 [Spinellus fusiger]
MDASRDASSVHTVDKATHLSAMENQQPNLTPGDGYGIPQRRPPPPPMGYPHPAAFMAYLPPGWTEHTGPGGQAYWYNAMTGQSTWQRPAVPVGGFMGHPGMIPMAPPFGMPGPPPKTTVPAPVVKKTKKKIPGTHWLLVRTEEGVEFYYDKKNKQSIWEMPEELKEPIQEMKEQERAEEEARLKAEEEARQEKLAEAEANRKRKLEHDIEVEAKRKKAEEEAATEMTEEDIMWQLQNMDPEEVENLGFESTETDNKTEVPTEKDTPSVTETPTLIPKPAPTFTYPHPVPVSAPVEKKTHVQPPQTPSFLTEEECIEVFTQMLTEKDISPYSTWEKELPKLIGDRRYALVQQHSKRKNLFNNYCRLLAQQNKARKSSEENYSDLLEEHANEKMYWEDFRRKVKDDERFRGMRETKLREIMFKEHIKKLRQNKGNSTKQKEEEYMTLLRTSNLSVGMRWRDAKRILEHDKRYQAIEIKTKREDLFRDYLETLQK